MSSILSVMLMKTILVANRGEIAVRIIRAAVDAGLRTVAVYSEDDSAGLHVGLADRAAPLDGRGPAAYRDIDCLLAAAKSNGADAIHPGYGLLSENAEFAAAVEAAGFIFVGPTPDTLSVFGDKVQARRLAEECSVPVPFGSAGPCELKEAQQFFGSLPHGAAMLVKAVAGGGGRGMRLVSNVDELQQAWGIASREAESVFGNRELFVEEFLAGARHIEVQIVGDGSGCVSHVGERECSLQRRYQKLVEVAPCPVLSADMRKRLTDAAVRIGKAVSYRGVGTVEFLVSEDEERFVFIEVNPRLQVEHTVTEEVYGVDLVRTQLAIASGKSLADPDLIWEENRAPRGFAIQVRINTESLDTDGEVRPVSGTLHVFQMPSGPGVRVDTHGYQGYATVPAFDSLLAKVIVCSRSNDYADAVRRMHRVLHECCIEGVSTNVEFLCHLLADQRVISDDVHTRFVDDNAEQLFAAVSERSQTEVEKESRDVPDGVKLIQSSMPGTVIRMDCKSGEEVRQGQQLLIIESMKMHHVVTSPANGIVTQTDVVTDDIIADGQSLVWIETNDSVAVVEQQEVEQDLDQIRSDLQEVYDRKGAGHDRNRPDAVAKRRKTGLRTARENIADLCDEGTFVEYGSVVLAAQRSRRKLDDLIKNSTGDGMVCGLGQINGDLFGPEHARAMLMSYDYMVMAGTQGMMNHYKKDRLFEIAKRNRLPVVLFAEGGGGRPGDTDAPGVAGLDCQAFNYFARLSALVPLVGITTGRCFAGNAVLLGCCDVIIATEGSNIGVGGPAMIEGGGLGVYRPEDVGPMEVQVLNGVVDIAVKDEAEAVVVAKKYLSYFQGAIGTWDAPDQRRLRFMVPEDRRRYYDMKDVLSGIADIGSVLELRPQWGIGIITALIRVEGRPMGVIANNPGHLAGAIDADGADKATRFIQLCDAFDLPVLSLCDCPGMMVGPESEQTAMVRRAGRMFVTGANIEVPFMTIIIRKGYGLGVMAMAGGSFKSPLFTVTWPTGEFGGMGLEGAVKLGYRKELEAIEDPAERQETYEKMVAQMYEHGQAVNMASHFELDDVIDPADSRHWITTALNSIPPTPVRTRKKRPHVDSW